MQGYFVYILLCSDGSLYTGWTSDVDRRVRQHNEGVASKYTRARLPAKLVFLEEVESRSAALRREIEIKKLERAQKLKLIGGETHDETLGADNFATDVRMRN